MEVTFNGYKPKHHIRVVTATSLFDGHDASINIMRRILQSTGVEVIHLGHNRSVKEIVDAAIEEDVQGIAVSSYQGGHLEYFKYMLDLLKECKATHIKVFGGGGGVIVPDEIKELEDYGITKIYSPTDGSKMGLQGMINHMMQHMDFSAVSSDELAIQNLNPENPLAVARMISAAELAVSHSFDDFSKIDIRTATILEAEKVPKTNKLLKLKIDTGLDIRTIVSGIAEYFEADEIIGKQISIVANLEPRSIKGVESKGMILMAEDKDGKLVMVSPVDNVSNGSMVK